MKKTFIANFIIILVMVALLSLISSVAYSFISSSIIRQNLGQNLATISQSLTYNVTSSLQRDYSSMREKITHETDKVVTSSEKLEILNSKKEQILFTKNIESGFGRYVKLGTGDWYEINGTMYQEKNSGYTYLDRDDDVTIVDLGKYFTVGEGQINAFSQLEDSRYIIFQYSDIIVYVKAYDYFKYTFSLSDKNIRAEEYFLVNDDGQIRYQSFERTSSSLLQLFRDNSNSDFKVQDFQGQMKMAEIGKDPIVTSSLNYNHKNCFVVSSRIGSDILDTQLYLVIVLSNEVSSRTISVVFAPMIATFLVVAVVLCVAQFISYIILMEKNSDIEHMVYLKFNEAIYKFRVDKTGKILKTSENFKDLIYGVKKYHNFKDFKFLEDVGTDFLVYLNKQKPFTIELQPEQTISGQYVALRCVVLRRFNHYIIVCVAATPLVLENKRHQKLALYDHVTDYPNAELFKEAIKDSVEEIKSDHAIGKTSICGCFIKNYESYRKSYGEVVSQKILKQAADSLQEILREKGYDLYCVGEAKFAFIARNLDDYEQANQLCKAILDYFVKPIEIDYNSLVFDFAFGIYNLDFDMFPATDERIIFKSLYRLVQKVSTSLLTNIDTYSFSIERFITSEEVLEQDIRKAIEQHEFVMYLQPQYDIFKHRIAGFELLLRWNNPKYYGQSPIHFIEVAEKDGLIIQIGKFINEEAMKIAKVLEPYDVDLSVNVSPVQLLQSGFVGEFNAIADKYEVKKDMISIEITETFLMTNFAVMIEKMNALRKDGYSIHLDDFGTGYSSMLYLKELPIDTIKIDKEFTKYISIDKYSRAIIHNLSSLAKTLGLDVICEGVEDEKQVQFLAKNDCNIIQGYIISKAVPLEQALVLLQEYNIDKTKIVNPDKDTKKK